MNRDWDEVPHDTTAPDFESLLAVLRCEEPSRPTLFEFFLNGPLYERLAGCKAPEDDPAGAVRFTIKAFKNAGYDYATMTSGNFAGLGFSSGERDHARTVSMNQGGVIKDRATFDAYDWPDPDVGEYDRLGELGSELPAGMKFIVAGPGGVLENAVSLVGYEDLCYMAIDDEPLAFDLFEAIGSRLTRYYEIVGRYDSVGACISNDDWGFKSQTMLSPPDMQRFVFPWHERIVAAIHAAGKPAILHSCGCFSEVIEDVIEKMKFDGRHSYEDNIMPVEDAYDRYGDRVATLGGIDVDFICRSEPEAVYERSKAMLERSAGRGGFALGTGNSVPDYVPDTGYFAMLRAVLDQR